ncbi:MAG: hypothetical protein Unbinned2514contig1000_36 [Prokaryotic dsDNA virus sp.]|nr:MAG: hypothetical protein Unbinned2514contig1000_36 [Prokaryotic dsDNA virus sp.]|tara:strand:- start:6556 stop:6846 length:291 start_codon:yes stop_codon:yes gene_type:complete
MSKKDKNDIPQAIDERYSLQTYDGLLHATEDLFNRYMVPCRNPVDVDQIKGASVLLREARGILDSRRRSAPATPSVEKEKIELTASGPFSVFQGGK